LDPFGRVAGQPPVAHREFQHAKKYEVDLSHHRGPEVCRQLAYPRLNIAVPDIYQTRLPPAAQNVFIEVESISRTSRLLHLDLRTEPLRRA
jgi:hypothetical protein